jgi:alpha-glucosidase (family GH31 glycosyl hydrolase)
MVGSELLVAPVLDPDTNEAAAYLPAGRWVHLWTGAIYGDAAAGATIKIAAPLGETAVF